MTTDDKHGNESMTAAVAVMARLWNAYHHNVVVPTTNGRSVSNAQRDVVAVELHRFYGDVRSLLQSGLDSPKPSVVLSP